MAKNIRKEKLKSFLKKTRQRKKFFFNVLKKVKDKEVLEKLIEESFDIYDIQYITKDIKNPFGYKEDETIGYFEINAISNGKGLVAMGILQELIYKTVLSIVGAYCNENNIPLKQLLGLKFLSKEKTINIWLKAYSTMLAKAFHMKYLSYVSDIINAFKKYLERKKSVLTVKEEGFTQNELVYKLFKEMKTSAAKKRFSNSMYAELKIDIKDKIEGSLKNRADIIIQKIQQRVSTM